MTITSYQALNNSMLNQITALADAGAGAAHLKIYTGSKPARGAAPAGTLLANFEMADPLAPAAANDALAPTLAADVIGLADGVPGCAILEDSDGTGIMSFDARLSTAEDSGEEVVVTVSGGGTQIATGAAVSMSAFGLSAPTAL